MGKIRDFEVIFDKINAIYYPGETLIGKIYFRIRERIKLSSIKFRINGYARCNWTEKDDAQANGPYAFTHSEQYLDYEKIIFMKQTDEDLYLDFGEYIYPFSFDLPVNIPASFEHSFGFIRYSVNAVIDMSWSLNKHAIKYFTVLSNVNVNLIPELNLPVKMESSRSYCCGLCRLESVLASVTLKKSAFVQEETIGISLVIHNRSKTTIDSFIVALRQCISFHAKSRSKHCNKTITSMQVNKVIKANSREAIEDLCLKVPLVNPSTSVVNEARHVIEISYSLLVIVDPKLMSNVSIPITIGSSLISTAEAGFVDGEDTTD